MYGFAKCQQASKGELKAKHSHSFRYLFFFFPNFIESRFVFCGCWSFIFYFLNFKSGRLSNWLILGHEWALLAKCLKKKQGKKKGKEKERNQPETRLGQFSPGSHILLKTQQNKAGCLLRVELGKYHIRMIPTPFKAFVNKNKKS